MMHALIVGPRQVGKSTLIRKVLHLLDRTVTGFETKKEAPGADGVCPVYLYPVGEPRVQTEENRVGLCGTGHPLAFPEVFERFAPRLLSDSDKGELILMDELGFLESSSAAFCDAVQELLRGGRPILAAVKNKDTPFLASVRENENCRCFFITEENRDELADEVLAFLRAQLS